MSATSMENKESTREEKNDEIWPEILENRISELINKVESLQEEIENLSGPIQQLLKDIRIAIYEIENPFSYVSQMTRRPDEIGFDREKENSNRPEKEHSANHLPQAADMEHSAPPTLNKENMQKIAQALNLLVEADFLSPEMKDSLKEARKKP